MKTFSSVLLVFLISLLLDVDQAGTFVVDVAQLSYYALKNQSITMEWIFTTNKTQGSDRELFVLCRLSIRTSYQQPDRPQVLYDVYEGVETPDHLGEQFSGRVQIDKDVLREGRIRLHVSRLRTEDSGLYECGVKTEDGSGSRICRLYIYDQAELVGHELIHAKIGDDVILPCCVSLPFDVTNLTIEWRFKDGRIYVYHRGSKDDETPDPKFKDRTFMFHDEFKKGNISLKLTNVTKEDEGSYTCLVPKLESQIKKRNFTLKVANENGPKGNRTVPGGRNEENNNGRKIGVGVGVGISVSIIIILIIFCITMMMIIIIIAGLCYWQRKRNHRGKINPGDEDEGICLQDQEQPN